MPHTTELFLDDDMIEMAASVTRKIHRPSKHSLNPIIRSDKWYEGNVNIPYATLYDEEEKCFKMWLRSGWDGLHDTDMGVQDHSSYTTYLTSKDGLHWDKPEVGAIDFCGRRDHNVVYVGDVNVEHPKLLNQGRKGFICSVAKNPNPKDESEKYVALAFNMKVEGLYVGYSPDGIAWQFAEEPFWRTPNDYATWGDDYPGILNYDEQEKKWILWRRVIPEQNGQRMVGNTADRDFKPVERYFRVWCRAESRDLKELRPNQIVLAMGADDPPDTEVYGLSCYKYEQVYIGYMNISHFSPGAHYLDVELATSRNGVDFTRVCRGKPFVPAGPQGFYHMRQGWLDYDFRIGSQAEPIIVDDTVYIYYQGYHRLHGTPGSSCKSAEAGAVGVITFKRDRFVSMETGLPGPCRLVTKPFVVEHPRLYLNAATWAQGEIRAEVLTDDWQPVPGFSEADSIAVRGDALAHSVRWKDKADLSELLGKQVRLRFCMNDARIHAMTLSTEDIEPKYVSDSEKPDNETWKLPSVHVGPM